MIKRLAVRTPHERQPISAMSGGNAQKVVLARQLVERPEVLVLAEPTQGVDVGAKEEIHRIITELAENGTAVLVVTSDLPEALRISDRLQVVRGGTTTVEFGPDATQVDVLAAAAGAEHTDTEEQKAVTEHRPRRPTTRDRPNRGRAMTATLTEPPRRPPHRRRGATGSCPSPVTGQELVLIGVIAVHLGRASRSATPAFLTAGSIQPLLVATAPIALIGVGMTIIIITGGIDVSVGGAIMVCSVITAKAAGRRGVAGAGRGAAVDRRRRRARPGQRRADRLRPGARDHHHVRHREHVPVPRPADLRLEHGQRHPADLRDLRPRRRRAAPSASRTRS